MFPRLQRVVTETTQIAEKKFLVKDLKLVVDRDRCVNCGTCMLSCPNNVIKAGAPWHTTSIALDPDKCSYCGVCQYMCPTGALQLYVDDEPIKNENLVLVQKKALPQLLGPEVPCTNKPAGKDGKPIMAKHYMDGHLKYKKEICQTGCRTCAVTCPTKALYFRRGKAWEQGEVLEFDRNKCIYCGGCAFVCPVAAFEIERTEIHHSDEFNEPFWPKLKQRLLDFRAFVKKDQEQRKA